MARSVSRGRTDAEFVPTVLVGAVLAALFARPEEMGARVEAWALWCALFAVGRLAREERDPQLGWLAVVLAGAGVAQAVGLAPLAGTGVVTATLGSPAHLGWTLAALLPFCGAMPRWAVGLVACGLTLTGSRTGFAMAAAGAPLWVDRRALAPLLVGVLAALVVDGLAPGVSLAERAADLTDPAGTAAGRAHLWSLYLADPSWWLGIGGGPESFVRRFPEAQDAYLAAHPAAAGFRSSLEHAHADLVEVGADYGALGLAGMLAAAARWAKQARGPEAACLVALAIGGLASPVLFTPSTAAIGALAAGRALGAPAERGPRFGAVVLLAGLLVADGLLARRVASEVARSEATWARVHGAPDPVAAARAAELDPRNPRAWMEVAGACDADPCRADALRRAARDR